MGRYTDFIVNEIDTAGQPVHLTSLEVPRRQVDEPAKTEAPAEAQSSQNGEDAPKVEPADAPEEAKEVSTEDIKSLEEIFGAKTTQDIVELYNELRKNPDRKRRNFSKVESAQIDDKDARTQAHQTVRRIFNSNLETVTGDNNNIVVAAVTARSKNNKAQWNRNAGTGRAHGKLGWDELGGEYVHFTLYKENKDTMEVCYFLASQTRQHVKSFQFAGTKDRRAATSQRVSAFRVQPERLRGLNKTLRNAKIGDFKYEKHALALGELDGNEFVITLRDCHFPGEDGLDSKSRLELGKGIVAAAVEGLNKHGFINYYGLQRFGSFATGTDEIGMKLLQESLKDAAELILSYSPEILAAAHDDSEDTKISSDDRKRALAMHKWAETGNSSEALAMLPRRFSAESNLIKHLGVVRNGKKINQNDYQGAFLTVPRTLRLMYVHAYQSLVWNAAASKRMELYGRQVVEGDLVIVQNKARGAQQSLDETGDVILQPAANDKAADDSEHTQVRALSAAEAAAGAHSLADVVLPLPGFDVIYPPNAIGEFYKTFMASVEGGGLDPHDMRRRWKDTSLSGDYRRLVERPRADVGWELRAYAGADEQLVETDLERLQAKSGKKDNGAAGAEEMEVDAQETNAPAKDRLAVILRLRLGSSTYATLALRELMKEGGVKTYKADFGPGRE